MITASQLYHHNPCPHRCGAICWWCQHARCDQSIYTASMG